MCLDSGDSFHECEIRRPLGLERMAGSGSLGARVGPLSFGQRQEVPSQDVGGVSQRPLAQTWPDWYLLLPLFRRLLPSPLWRAPKPPATLSDKLLSSSLHFYSDSVPGTLHHCSKSRPPPCCVSEQNTSAPVHPRAGMFPPADTQCSLPCCFSSQMPSRWEVPLGHHVSRFSSCASLPLPRLSCFSLFVFSFFLERYLIELVFFLHNYCLCLKVECKLLAGWGF